MIVSFFAVFSQSGFDRTYRDPNKVQVSPGEFAFKVELEVDDDLFLPAPVPTVRLKVDRSMLVQNISMETEEKE